jgi:AraC-like DNA-binding protein
VHTRPRTEAIRTWHPADRPDLELRIDVTARASLFVVHPGEIHANATDDDGCSFRSMYVPADVVRRVASEVMGRPCDVPFLAQPVVHDADLVRLFTDAHRTLEVPGAQLTADTLLVELFALLIGRYARPATHRSAGKERAAVRRVRDRLTDGFAENVSLDELAAVAGLSPYHLSRVFAREVGMPPHAYQISVRILQAKRLIRARVALADVANATGFVDQSHLSRHFKWLVKLTPGQYAAGSSELSSRVRPS